MVRLTDPAQGYCEMYCKKYGRCFGDPGDCDFKEEATMYEALREYEGLTSAAPREKVDGSASKWISVKDRLPEEDVAVLVVVSGVYENICFDHAVESAVWYKTEGWVLESWPEWETAGVTHWMELPEPPLA